eukprot:5255090-Prymnesium_polylepis.2
MSYRGEHGKSRIEHPHILRPRREHSRPQQTFYAWATCNGTTRLSGRISAFTRANTVSGFKYSLPSVPL